jgi:hypothetical protein
MKRKGFISVIAFLLAFIGNMYIEGQKYEKEMYDSEAKSGLTAVNYAIQGLIIRSFQPLINGPGGVDGLNDQVNVVMLRVDWIIEDMEEDMTVPKKYKKAHQELLTAYKNFRPYLIDYQVLVHEAIEQEAVDSPSAQELDEAYQQVSLAAGQWYSIYRLENNDDSSKYMESALGSVQDQLIYEDYVKVIVSRDLQTIEGDVLPHLEAKNDDEFFLMLSNQQQLLPRTADYLKHTKVPEPYAKAHQNLLNAYTSLYTFIENGDFNDVNDDYRAQFKAQYEELKQAFDVWNLVLAQQTEERNVVQVDERSEDELSKYHYARNNYDIQQLILRSYDWPIAGPAGIDNLKNAVDNVIRSVNEVMKEMEQTKVPEKYEQAHQDLLAAYQNFLPVITDYYQQVQEAMEQAAAESPSNQELNDAYLQISQAAEQWYEIYKKVNGYGQIDGLSTLGNLQDRLVYEEYVKEITYQQLTDLENTIIPYVEQKDYDAVYKMLHGQKFNLPSRIDYLEQTKVPEVYEKAHQNLLSAYTGYYNLITTVGYGTVNDDLLEKLTLQYKEMKKAIEEWKTIQLEELGHW